MGLKTPQQYRESLRDGRVNYWDGERIDDVTSHDRFKVPIETAMRDYEYDAPGRREVTTYTTETGATAHRVFQVPRTEADLHARLEMLKHLSIVGGTTSVFMALQTVKDQVAKVAPERAENIDRLYRFARDNDLRASEVITDAKGDRGRRPFEQDDPDLYMRIVDRNADGIVVRGAKLHITGAALVHELVVMPTKAMGPDEVDYSVSFSTPANAKGVKIINRSYAEPGQSSFDYPISGRANMPEGFVIFDDVFVPWDRVFLAGEWQLAGVLAHSLGLWERVGGLIAAVEESAMMVGMVQLLAEYNGIAGASHIQEKIAELICYAEVIRHALDCAIRGYESTESGMIYPNSLDVNVGKYYFAANFHQMVRHVHDIAGGLVVTMPLEGDLQSEETGPYLRKYLHTREGVSVEDRMRLYNLIRDKTADAYGGWTLVTNIQAGGGLAAQKIVMNRAYDLEHAKQLAREAAGISN